MPPKRRSDSLSSCRLTTGVRFLDSSMSNITRLAAAARCSQATSVNFCCSIIAFSFFVACTSCWKSPLGAAHVGQPQECRCRVDRALQSLTSASKFEAWSQPCSRCNVVPHSAGTRPGPSIALYAQHSTDLLLGRLDCPPQHLSKSDGQRGQHLLWVMTHRSSNSHRRGLLLQGRLLYWGHRRRGRPWRRRQPGCKRVMQSWLWLRAELCLRLECRVQRTIWLWRRPPLQGLSSKGCL